MSDDVKAVNRWPDNAALIADVAKLGYLRESDDVLDCTYGPGKFWTRWRPKQLTRTDLNPEWSPDAAGGLDFREMPFTTGSFDAVVFDPPYRLNGRPDPEFDGPYGTDERTRWQDRMKLIYVGITECLRVVRVDGYLFVKCQDQVCSGEVRWQTMWFTQHAQEWGGLLVDMFHFVGGRPQPKRKRKDGTPVEQEHARRNYSSLLVIRKVREPWHE